MLPLEPCGDEMPGKGCKHRKHTPIVSKKQAGFFGAEYARKKAGKKGRTKMGKAELRRHLKEYGRKRKK